MEDPKKITRYLGCERHFSDKTCPTTKKPVKAVEWDMEPFMAECVRVYEELSGTKCLRKVVTPFLPAEDEPPLSKKYFNNITHRCKTVGLLSNSEITSAAVATSNNSGFDSSSLTTADDMSELYDKTMAALRSYLFNKQSGHDGIDHAMDLQQLLQNFQEDHGSMEAPTDDPRGPAGNQPQVSALPAGLPQGAAQPAAGAVLSPPEEEDNLLPPSSEEP